MSVENNAGIILFANGNASGGAVAFAATGVAKDSSSITTPLLIPINSANRVVLTCAFGFAVATQYVVRCMINNNNYFAAPSGGSALPTTGSNGAVNAQLNQNIPVLAVGQNSSSAGFQMLDNTYVGPATTDYIYLVGNLAGYLVVRVTATYAAPLGANDYFVCGVSLY